MMIGECFGCHNYRVKEIPAAKSIFLKPQCQIVWQSDSPAAMVLECPASGRYWKANKPMQEP
jgi:hypothetical protein